MGSIASLEPGHVPEELFAQADHVHFGSYYLQDTMREHWPSLFARAREAGITTSFDTGWDPRENWHRERITELLPHTDLFMPSEEEIRHIFAASSVQEALEQLPADRGGIVAVKQGSAGSCFVDADGGRFRHAGFKVDPVDTTGAGDSFNAGMIFGFLHGRRGEELLAFANACGALATQRIGGASSVPSLSEVDRFMSERKG
jgi:sugar/nucleoside kinase (ribokinase family)